MFVSKGYLKMLSPAQPLAQQQQTVSGSDYKMSFRAAPGDAPAFRFTSHGENQPFAIKPAAATAPPTPVNVQQRLRSGGEASPELRMRELFDKWGLAPDHMYFRRFSLDPFVGPGHSTAFLEQFFCEPIVRSEIKVLNKYDTLVSGGSALDPSQLEFLPLTVTQTDMSMFDGLFDCGAVRKNGAIVKCFDDAYSPPDGIGSTPDPAKLHNEPGDAIIADEMHRVLLDATAPAFGDAFASDSARADLLYHIFAHLALGGRVNQWEDNLGAYLEVTKAVYREMVSVTRTADSGDLILHGSAFMVVPKAQSSSGGQQLFPMRHRQNFFIVCINPLKRHITCWYHASTAYY
ncbi:hypothetical protein BC828DRAFT_383347, partial [Blastocladiella britannica]